MLLKRARWHPHHSLDHSARVAVRECLWIQMRDGTQSGARSMLVLSHVPCGTHPRTGDEIADPGKSLDLGDPCILN